MKNKASSNNRTSPMAATPRVTTINVNGADQPIDVDSRKSLLWVLRDDLDLTGSHYGCGEGLCGACTVLVDGTPRRSCITTVGDVVGRAITTIEGVAQGGLLHPLQQAFLREEALQCGYCTSGMIMSGVALLERSPSPSRREILRHMEGHVCRCGVYQNIIAAIQSVAETVPEEGG